MKQAPLASIIIVNWNGGEVFKTCLESLSRIDYPRWELIVVDNGSTDDSQNLALKIFSEKQTYKLIRNKRNLGFAPANNQGYRKAKGKYILLLNNDTKVEPDFLVKMVGRMERNKSIGVMQPKIFLMDKMSHLDNAGSFLTYVGFFEHWGFLEKDSAEFNKEKEIFSAKGACMLIRKSVADKVGLFDRDFVSYFEESDFCWRVWLAGYKVIFYPGAAIYHKVGFTTRRQNVLEINLHYYKNRISSLIKNLSVANLLVILPFHLTLSLGISLLFFLRGQPKNSFMIIKAVLWNFWSLPRILSKRRVVQKIRIKSDRELFPTILHPISWEKFYKSLRRIEEDIKR